MNKIDLTEELFRRINTISNVEGLSNEELALLNLYLQSINLNDHLCKIRKLLESIDKNTQD